MGAKPRPPVQFRKDGTVRIPLTKGYWATVDASDYHLVAGKPWHALVCGGGKRIYASRSTNPGHLLMHRLILGLTDLGTFADHVDGNGLNNCRRNLRACNENENARNVPKRRDGSSRFKGVSWRQDGRKWAAGIRVGGKRIHLGIFRLERQAARAYDAAALRLHGQFARLNFSSH